MAEITQRDGTWSFDGEVLRVVPGGGRGVHQLRVDMGELAIPLAALSGVSFEPGKKRARLRLRMRAGADPFTQGIPTGGLPDSADPYSLPVEHDRAGAAEYLADAVRNALLIEQIPVDAPCDRYLLPGPPVPRILNGSDGKVTFDGEQCRIEWGWGAEEAKKSAGPRTLPFTELAGIEWTRAAGWENGWVRLVPKGSHVPVKPSHDPNCVVLWGFREGREVAQAALLVAAVTARLPHPYAAAEPPPAAAPALEKPPAQAGPPADDPDALLRRLRELGELRDAGILTDEEFQQAKQAVLRRL